jgi:predicted lipid-binding transport protein (Tim44 family)
VNIASAPEMASGTLHGRAAQIESVSPSPSVRPKEEEPQGGVVTIGGILIAGVLIGSLLLMRSRLLRR